MVEEVRRLNTADEVRAALTLSRRVFNEFVAPDYGEAGRETFIKVTEPEENIAKWKAGEYVFYGVFADDVLMGTAASRKDGSHVMLLFVEKAYHRRGVARALMEVLVKDAPGPKITVNAAPYAEAAYERMGFIRTGEAVTKDGMTFIPMEYIK